MLRAMTLSGRRTHKMKLIEVVRGLRHQPATLAAVGEVATRMGKETVDVRESPGLITTRINAGIAALP
jgi:3-hydroxybutyryl-CoA dehydrogenase